MKIISKFKDYYDSAQGLGVDPTLIYKRITKEITFSYAQFPLAFLYDYPSNIKLGSYWDFDSRHYYYPTYIFIAGKVYVHFTYTDKDDNEQSCTLEQLNRLAATYSKEHYRIRDLAQLNQLHSTEIPANTFVKVGAPVFMYSTTRAEHISVLLGEQALQTITINPCLRDLGVAYLLDSYSMYQAISTYLGNELAPKEEPHVATDAELLQARGFNNQSFKRVPEESKKARRRKKKKQN